jgi:hypothetical protein
MEQKPIGYCLAIMKSEGVNLIGGELLFSTLLDYIKMPCSEFFIDSVWTILVMFEVCKGLPHLALYP